MLEKHTLLRLAGVGLALPTTLVLSDELLLSAAEQGAADLSAAFYGWLVGQTALISFAAGKWLPNWFWRVIVLTWTLLLLNLLLFNSALAGPWRGAFDANLLAFAFVSVQFSLVGVWFVLGAGRWQWRLPAAMIAVLPAGFMIAELERIERWLGDVWNEVAALQVAITFLFAGAMRYRGYRIDLVEEAASSSDGTSIASSQFSIGQLLAWTAALAPILILMRTVHYMLPARFGLREWGLVVACAALLAPPLLAAIWAAFGAGRTWLKLAVVAFIAAATGLALRLVEEHLGTTRGWGAVGWNVLIGNLRMTKFTNVGYAWLVWTELSSFLLVGMLLVFRVNSYRLVRRRGVAKN